MNWIDFFDEILVINLGKREDRLLRITEHFEEYQIPFKRVEAIKHEKGAEGLLATMILIFQEALSKGYENILVFEDDAKIVVTKHELDDTMNKVVEQLPKDYIMCFLGCQPTKGFNSFYSPNLLPVQGAFATHAVMYSKKGIELILASNFSAPIDSHYVAAIQEPYGNCYAINPFLCTQEEGYSDIGNAEINWNPFMQPRHERAIIELKQRG